MSAALHIAHRVRSARRRRGAAVFVVVLVVTLLTALGLFAVKNATLSNQASGFNRQLTQVHYITDYALVATAAEMMANPHETQELMTNYTPSSAALDSTCEGQDLLMSPTCRLISYDDLDTRISAANPTTELLVPYAANAPGSLGGPLVDADMRIEVSDLYSTQPIAGYEVGGGAEQTQVQAFAYVTVTSSGLVRPKQATFNTWDATSAGAAATELSRAHVRLGPLPVQK